MADQALQTVFLNGEFLQKDEAKVIVEQQKIL